MTAPTRKPTNAQARALAYLVDGTPHGVESWYDAKQVERETTWLACIAAGWVEREPIFNRVLITSTGRAVAERAVNWRNLPIRTAQEG